jgi:hypothetical protein
MVKLKGNLIHRITNVQVFLKIRAANLKNATTGVRETIVG